MDKTHYERVVGGTEESREAALEKLQQWFETKSESLSEYELNKSEQDVKIIKEITAVVDKMVGEWEGDPKPLPIEKVHILEPGSIKEISKGKISGGIHQPLGLDIGIEKSQSLLETASAISHELFHAKSYKAARVGKTAEDVRLYRSGISMIDRKTDVVSGEEKEYFGILEEAIVAESTKRLLDQIKEKPIFKKEAEALDRMRDWITKYLRKTGVPEKKLRLLESELKYIPDIGNIVQRVLTYSNEEEKRAAYAAGTFQRLVEEKKVESWERYEERSALNNLMDKIISKSRGRFENRDEVFEEFAKANYSGKYFRIARIIESALGKGSFRELAEKFSK